jgi:transcriptional regulator with XRE-family HTH domain
VVRKERLITLRGYVEVETPQDEWLVLSGENLRTLRGRVGLTQRELAETLGVARRTIQRWEAGDTYPREPRLLYQVVRLLAPEFIRNPSEAYLRVGDVEIDLADPNVNPIAIVKLPDGAPVVMIAVDREWPETRLDKN